MTAPPSAGRQRVLLIHFGQLGDAVMALPAAQALRRHFDAAAAPAALTVLAATGSDAIFRMAGFSDVWAADRRRWKQHPLAGVGEIAGLFGRVRRRRFDLSVDLHSYKETNLLAWAAGIPKRVAMLRPTRSWPALITDPPPPDDTDGRLLDRYCEVLRPLGIAVTDRVPRLEAPLAARERMAAQLLEWAGTEPILGICPGAGHPGRRWPAERFAELARSFAAAHAARIAVFAGPEEDESLLAVLRGVPRVRIWSGLSIPELAAALARCRVVVSNPTGPSHIAAAVGAKVLTLGEIPAFDPVGITPGAVLALRATGSITSITTASALAALQSLIPNP